MGAYDPNDQRVKVLDQLARGLLVPLANPLQAASQIKRRGVVRHKRMQARTCTARKTWIVAPRLPDRTVRFENGVPRIMLGIVLLVVIDLRRWYPADPIRFFNRR